MPNVSVTLPAGDLIDYFAFCKAIAEAVCPAGESALEGIDCVIGKTVVCRRSVDDNSPKPVIETSQSFDLDAADRRALAEVMSKLPQLRYPMSDEEIAAFTDAYLNLPGRPAWMPLLIGKRTIMQRKVQQDVVWARHQKTIQQEFEAKRLIPVDASYVPVHALMAGTFLPRAQAIAYLERYGMAYDDGASQLAELPMKEQKAVGSPRLSAEQKAALVKRRNELKAARDPKYVQKTADEFHVTVRTVYTTVKNAMAAREAKEAERPKGAPWTQLVTDSDQ